MLATDNVNLSHSQKELLQWHFCLDHFNLCWIQHLTQICEGDKEAQPILPTRHKSTSLCQLPICAACQFGKAHKQPSTSIHHAKTPKKDGILKANALQPGLVVLSDQYVSSFKGHLLTTKGKEKDHEHYSGGTIFTLTTLLGSHIYAIKSC